VSAWRPLVVALAVGITVLPALSWAVSRIVGAGPLRDGVLVVGLAPCEIASVATTAMAGGEAAVSAGVLIGSTIAAVALAGPILTLEAGHAGVSPGGIIANLALVVALPLAVGLAARACAEAPPPDTSSAAANRLLAAARVLATARAERVASRTALAAVAALVALIAAEIRLSAAYLAVAAALLLFLLGSALVGHFLGARADRPTATALLLTTSMRDFAIAAGLAAAAFGPAAAAPLGLYGVAVLVWGTAVAGVLRQRAARTPAENKSNTNLSNGPWPPPPSKTRSSKQGIAVLPPVLPSEHGTAREALNIAAPRPRAGSRRCCPGRGDHLQRLAGADRSAPSEARGGTAGHRGVGAGERSSDPRRAGFGSGARPGSAWA
jgi:predicted Na+-dependent transporter